MHELYNKATSFGNYKKTPISLSSNTSIVNISPGLELTIDTNKTKWKYGNLTYKFKITNISSTPYLNLVITTLIDTRLIELVPNSITIDNVIATQNEYSYNEETHFLNINLNEIKQNQTKEINFSVRKRRNVFFILKNKYTVTYGNSLKIDSNTISIISPITSSAIDNNDCSSLNWRP